MYLSTSHAPLVTFLDFSMLKTLPEGQVRNGFAGASNAIPSYLGYVDSLL